MRNLSEVEFIKSRITDPILLKKFLNIEKINHLVKIFEETESKKTNKLVIKNTGPVTLHLDDYLEDCVINEILAILKTKLGNFEIASAFWFKTSFPHIIHNDDLHELPKGIYKAVTIPLKLYGIYQGYPKLCFFDQYYFHGPSKFFKGSYGIPTYYNKQIYDYCNVDNLSDKEIDQEIYDMYLTHLIPSWLEGLSLSHIIDWVPGDAIMFDCVRLHCASDFRKMNIKAKLGISIFTIKN